MSFEINTDHDGALFDVSKALHTLGLGLSLLPQEMSRIEHGMDPDSGEETPPAAGLAITGWALKEVTIEGCPCPQSTHEMPIPINASVFMRLELLAILAAEIDKVGRHILDGPHAEVWREAYAKGREAPSPVYAHTLADHFANLTPEDITKEGPTTE
jgi:hypothetical protein